ncbi:hypothetical protein, partial [Mesorhizobium abyssinicae]
LKGIHAISFACSEQLMTAWRLETLSSRIGPRIGREMICETIARPVLAGHDAVLMPESTMHPASR